ncbi:hypothetical protein [Pseudoxanthomonas putridarboris]|uniref:hypothetical protein n=1 Tax=Pseudoxanthomonas putridarboris TaxID=752605 RepID=UPI00311DEC36
MIRQFIDKPSTTSPVAAFLPKKFPGAKSRKRFQLRRSIDKSAENKPFFQY